MESYSAGRLGKLKFAIIVNLGIGTEATYRLLTGPLPRAAEALETRIGFSFVTAR
jgi:hypothetical protein